MDFHSAIQIKELISKTNPIPYFLTETLTWLFTVYNVKSKDLGVVCKAHMIGPFLQAILKIRVLDIWYFRPIHHSQNLWFFSIYFYFYFFFTFGVMSLHLLWSLWKHFFSSTFFIVGSVDKFQFCLQYLAKILKLSYYFFLIFPERPKYFIRGCLYYTT